MNAANAASRIRSRTGASSSTPCFVLDIGTTWYHTKADGTYWYHMTRRSNEVAASRLLWEHRIQRNRVGNRRGTLHLAATPSSRTVRGPATSARPPQLPLHRVGVSGPGR